MTIPFGRRRLILTFRITAASADIPAAEIPPEADDRELERLSRLNPLDLDRAHWNALSLMYGARIHR